MTTDNRLRLSALSSTGEFSDEVENLIRQKVVSSPFVPETEADHSSSSHTNKNPLNSRKDGSERMALIRSSSEAGSGCHYQKPFEGEAIHSSSTQAELGSVSYFPDHVARVSYIASVLKPDEYGNYLKQLQGGMNSLATRLAPSYFPGTVVRHITTQVDGYFPAGECLTKAR